MVENSFSSPRNAAFAAGLRVLVVDYDPTWLRILEKMLKKCFYEVKTCGFARDALNLLRERKDAYDIVISDVYMPDMDGFELLEHIVLEMDLPVIMMSVDGATSQVMKGVQHGACDYLLKPIRMNELQNIWQHAFRKKIHEVKDIEILEGMDHIQMTRNGSDQSDDGHFLWGEDLTSVKKRKDDKGPGDNSFVKKARIVWSVDFHQKFVNAVDQIGFDKVSPEKILNLMNVPWLTRENVAVHLQKYCLYLSRLQKQNDLTITFEGINYSHTTSGDSTASVGTQYSCNMQHPDVSNDNCRISFNSLPLNYLESGNYESDQEGTVSMPVAASRISLTTDVSDFWQSRDSQSEFSHSCPSSESEVNFATFDSTFLFVPSSDDEKKHEGNKQEHKDDEKEHKDDKEEQTWSRNHKSNVL